LILAGPKVDSGPLLARDQQYFQSVIDAINDKKLQNRIQVIPQFIENPETYIKASDVFLFPSTREALGTPVLEALACGVPVVTSKIAGVFDQWVEAGVNGFNLDFSPDLWAEKITVAVGFKREVMKQASQKILHIASTEVIDQEYYERMKQLVGMG